MSRKPVWRNQLEEDCFREKTCRVCFQPDESTKRITGTGPGCPLLAKAHENKMPKEWTRRRTASLGDTYRCSEFRDKPPTQQRKSTPAQTPAMFDIEPQPVNLVPVEGWPDYQAQQRKGQVDHQ